MDLDLLSCTFENLNNLKFNDLKKFSSQYQVNKRWAKKREIIEKLLLLRDEEIKKNSIATNAPKQEIKPESEIEWVDGKEVLSKENTNNEENDRRLTYNVNPEQDSSDRRLTFTITRQDQKNPSVNKTSGIPESCDRRLTYNADEMKIKMGVICEIPNDPNFQEAHLIHTENESVVCGVNENMKNPVVSTKNGDLKKYSEGNCVGSKNNLDDGQEENKISEKASTVNNKNNNVSNISKSTLSSKVKMLTVPYSKVLRPSKRDQAKALTSNNSSSVKAAEKTAHINRSSAKQAETTKLQRTSQIIIRKNPLNVKEKVTKPQQPAAERNSNKLENRSMTPNNGTNIAAYKRSVLPRRKSKTEDNVLVQNLTQNRSLKFFSPRDTETRKGLPGTARNLSAGSTIKSRIPKAKPLAPPKPATATKMPDFSKIHKNMFEQMDSLLDYQRKKEERAKKLFGFTQPRIPVKDNTGNLSGIYQLKSSCSEKENSFSIDRAGDQLVGKTKNTLSARQDINQAARKEGLKRVGTKADLVKSLREENRMHLHGVRTNKRFELLMKRRNL